MNSQTQVLWSIINDLVFTISNRCSTASTEWPNTAATEAVTRPITEESNNAQTDKQPQTTAYEASTSWIFNVQQSQGPLIPVNVSNLCWNSFSGSYSSADCNIDMCCINFNNPAGCCKSGAGCCKSLINPHLCCGPDQSCCGSSYHTICCHTSDICIDNESDGTFHCSNNHWIPFVSVLGCWAASLLTYLFFSCRLYRL